MGKSKLTNDQKWRIKALYGGGKSVRWLAQTYGVTRGTIHYIVNPVAAAKQRQRMKLRQAELRKLNKVGEQIHAS